MGDFRVELDTVKLLFLTRHGGQWTGGCRSGNHKAIGQNGHLIAVTHPHIQTQATTMFNMVFNAVKQAYRLLELHLGIAKLTQIRRADFTTELLGHGLHTVANTQQRNAQVKYRIGHPG